MSHQQTPHLGIGGLGGVLEDEPHVVKIGDAHLLGFGGVVVVEDVDAGVA